MSNKSSTTLFLAALAATALTGSALMLSVPVLFGAFGEPPSWVGWVTAALVLLFLGFGWAMTRLRRHTPGSPQSKSVVEG